LRRRVIAFRPDFTPSAECSHCTTICGAAQCTQRTHLPCQSENGPAFARNSPLNSSKPGEVFGRGCAADRRSEVSGDCLDAGRKAFIQAARESPLHRFLQASREVQVDSSGLTWLERRLRFKARRRHIGSVRGSEQFLTAALFSAAG
jgi:hypothetical protein